MLLSGCSDISFGDNTILRPPRATGDKAEIQDIINEEAGGSYNLKYPQNGENRSAVIMRELENQNLSSASAGNNGSITEYAVALYSTENDSKLNVSFVMCEGDKWKCEGTFTNSGTGVDCVTFDDIDGNGIDEIIIGWSTYDVNRKMLSAYSIENNTIQEMKLEETYSSLVVTDMTGDNADDLVLLSISSTKYPSQAKIIQYSGKEKSLISKVDPLELDSEVTEFSGVTAGKIDKSVNGIVIDGKKSGGTISTQIIYYDEELGVLKNPLYVITDDGKISNETTRKDSLISRDIDGDGIIEVPVVNPMSASPDEDVSNICNITSWKKFSSDDETLYTTMNTVVNYNDGYYFIMPKAWNNGLVSTRMNADKRQLTFYVWNSGTMTLGDKLLVITRYTPDEWQNIDKRALIDLSDLNSGVNAVFAAQICKTYAQDSLNITEKEVKSNTVAIANN